MSKRRTWRAFACSGVALVSLAAMSTSARAQSVEQRLQELEAKFEQMEREKNRRVQELEAKVDELEKEKESAPKISAKKLEVKSADGDFSIRAGGRLMVDGLIGIEDGPEKIGDAAEIRRARLFIDGTVFRDWDYKIQYDFADGDADPKDVYLRYTGLEPTDLTVGHFKEPFSLNELTSSKYITFMERALPVDAFAPSRNLGFGVHSFGAVGNGTWTLGTGFFGEGFDDQGDENEGFGIPLRVTFSPIAEKTQVVHLGGYTEYRKPNQGGEVRFRSRPEMHATSTRLVDTGTISDTDNTWKWGVEAAAVWGPFSLQGEYIQTRVSSGPAGNPNFSGWYVFGSWFPTGESRAYDAESADFGRVKPHRNFSLSDGGWGAWELALRYSNLDLSAGNVQGGDEDNVTVGVNWYVNPQIRLMANYVQVVDLKDTGDPEEDGSTPGGFEMRAQIDF